MKEIDFRKFKNESYYLKLKELASSAPQKNLAFVFFGGTGAVGGQAAIEITQAFEFVVSVRPEWAEHEPLLVITGLYKDEIERFRSKLYRSFDAGSGHGFERVEDHSDKAYLVLKRKSGVTIEFYELHARPEFKANLNELVKDKRIEEIISSLKEEASNMTSPFESFLKDLIAHKKLPDGFKFQAVLSGIPIPSVAAYHFNEIDKLLETSGIKKLDTDRAIEREIKIKILHGIANDFGRIKSSLSNEMLVAHTTSVGGMYTIEGDKPVIRLGYAHSALDEQLLEKQFFANELTKKYSELGLKILITAAAIGIDNIFTKINLPVNTGIFNKYAAADERHLLPFPSKFLDKSCNLIFPPAIFSPLYPILDSKGEQAMQSKTEFCENDKTPMQKLKIEYGLRSGENGVFSIDNAYALYLNMKIATQEELSHVLAYNAMFGDDKQKPWFDGQGICYQTETENSILVFALLNNRAEFRAYQTSGFTPKAFQDLGSAKHQCELHTIGLYMLAHRLKTLNPKLISEKVTSKYRESEVVEFVDKNTEPLSIENIVGYDPEQKAKEFSALLSINSPEELARFIGFNSDSRAGFIHTFFQHLLGAVKKTIATITSLGTPIVFLHNGKVKVLAGPYCSAIDSVMSHNDTLAKYIKDGVKEYSLDPNDYFEWLVANNGFVDLRPQATITTEKTHKNGLKGKVKVVFNIQGFRDRIEEIQDENTRNSTYGYFTTSGTVAFIGRVIGLYEQLKSFDISLGTLNNWRALFPFDSNLNHPVIPGIVEAMRMYTEGLGKVTGFELLYPSFGYYKR
ncbi:MAG: hypothetical protein ACKVU0_06175 [Saprospiraceae bacterium]